jgi:hypothetical protein
MKAEVKTYERKKVRHAVASGSIFNILVVWRKIYLAVKILWDWTNNYSGRFAPVVKGIPVAVIAVGVTYPWWSFPLWMWLGLTVGVPWCYVVGVAYVIQIFAFSIAAAAITYQP